MVLNVSLASTLLEVEKDSSKYATKVGGQTWTTGNKVLDKDLLQGLLSGGNVTTIASLSAGLISKQATSLPLHIVATHLLEEAHQQSIPEEKSSTSVFIVTSPSQAAPTIQGLRSLLTTKISEKSKEKTRSKTGPIDAENCLNSISLLRYLDISGLAESVSEVFAAMQSQRPPQRTILLIQGMNTLLNSTHRQSGITYTAALLSSIMGSVTSIARSSKGLCLVLVEVDMIWASQADRAQHSGCVLDTAFSSMDGKVLMLNLHDVFRHIVTEHADILLALHDGDGKVDGLNSQKRIVEIAKDVRMGIEVDESALETWAIWNI